MKDEQLAQRIKEYAEQSRAAMVKELSELVAIPSVGKPGADGLPFGKECVAVLEKALDMSREKGLTAQNYGNYYGTAVCEPTVSTQGDVKTIGVFSHLDVVPVGDDWTYPPFEATEKDGLLFGRGVTDNKNAAVVGMFLLKAFRALDLPLKSRLSLFFGCAEEIGMDDIAQYVKEQPMPDFSIVPDSGFPVCHGEKGIMQLKYKAPVPFEKITSFAGGLVTNMVPGKATATVPYSEAWLVELRLLAQGQEGITVTTDGSVITVEAQGLPAHAARPEGSLSAILLLAGFLSQVRALPDGDRGILDLVTHVLSDDYAGAIGATAFQDGPSGPLTCICGLAETRDGFLVLDFNIRYPVTDKGERVEGAMNAFFQGKGWECIFSNDSGPAYVPADDPKVKLLCEVYHGITGKDATPYTMGGGTYVRKLKNAVGFGMSLLTPPVDLGPGRGGAHQADEVVSIDLMVDALQIYILSILEIDRLLNP